MIKYNDILKKIKELSKKSYFPKILIALFLILMLAILFIDFDSSSTNQSKDENLDLFEDSNQYKTLLEDGLEELLVSIEGVGKSKIMINVSETKEFVYAEEITNSSERYENEIVIIDKSSGDEPLIRKMKTPVISGAIIVCEGGDDPKICEKVYKAVSTALNLPTNRIYVTEMK